MHLLSQKNREEFLATPQLIRFDYSYGNKKYESTLLIKGSTLLLKCITLKTKIELLFTSIDDRLLYVLRIWDDAKDPANLWSILEHKEEKDALLALAKDGVCQLFLFNELGVNTAWKSIKVKKSNELFKLLYNCPIGPIKQDKFQKKVSQVLYEESLNPKGKFLSLNIDNNDEWKFIRSTYISNQLNQSSINLNENIEGSQQEELSLWLIDNIHPKGAFHSPQINTKSGKREFTDLLLTYNNGCFLFESKALSVLCRNSLPSQADLTNDTGKHIEKAIKQLKGAIRQLKLGTPIYSASGNEISVERTIPAHCLIVVSELKLVPKTSIIGLDAIKDFMISTQAYIHLVDPSELMRIVQAADIIFSNSNKISKMEAFDFYLLERAKIALEKETLNIEVILRVEK